MRSTRKVITIDLDSDKTIALKFLKPFSSEFDNHLIVVYEDAYGGFSGELIKTYDIFKRYGIDGNDLYESFND